AAEVERLHRALPGGDQHPVLRVDRGHHGRHLDPAVAAAGGEHPAPVAANELERVLVGHALTLPVRTPAVVTGGPSPAEQPVGGGADDEADDEAEVAGPRVGA